MRGSDARSKVRSGTTTYKISQAWGYAYDPVYGELQTVNTKFNGVDNVHTLTLEDDAAG